MKAANNMPNEAAIRFRAISLEANLKMRIYRSDIYRSACELIDEEAQKKKDEVFQALAKHYISKRELTFREEAEEELRMIKELEDQYDKLD